jgi:hypothetical protein
MPSYRSARQNPEPSFFQRVAGTLGLGSDPGDGRPAEDVSEWLDMTLKEAYGLAEIPRDDDGDIPITYGSTEVFIRHGDPDSPFLEIFAPLLHDFRMSPDVYEAVNSISRQVPMAKAVVTDDNKQILLCADLLLIELSPDELMFTIEHIGEAADRFDTILHKRFGGEMVRDDDADEIDV